MVIWEMSDEPEQVGGTYIKESRYVSTMILRLIRLAAFLLALAGLQAGAASAAPPPCPDNGSKLQTNCTKEVQI